MSIPLDRLYDHLYHKSNHDMLIYGWIPHGSKKLSDIHPLRSEIDNFSPFKIMTTPQMLFHDQEPLNFGLYSNKDICHELAHQYQTFLGGMYKDQLDRIEFAASLHLKAFISPIANLYDQVLLVHSEKNSIELDQYQAHDFLGVYYWCHAMIAADWFRYAEHDDQLTPVVAPHYDFLIYNRAWTGTREYRLKFTELLYHNNLMFACKTSFAPYDENTHYSQHTFHNSKFKIQNSGLHNYFPLNTATSSASADYDNQDYAECGIEVVLETLFDDTRWHLTEKSLRPIACGKPFILMATPGSLEYLRSYGFETFSPMIDETYDLIEDPVDRMQAVITEMQRIKSLDQSCKQELYQHCYKIAARNKQKFFSQHFQKTIEQEFVDNVNHALVELKKYPKGKNWTKSCLLTPKHSCGEQADLLRSWLAAHN